MKKVLSDYVVKKDAMALLHAKSFEYRTIVITTSGKLYVKMSPFEIIKKSCLLDMATYDGRRMAVKLLTGYKNKVPIRINSLNNIFGFPTASPTSDNCVWIFYHHIKAIKDSNKNGSGKKSIVYFTNNTRVTLDVSSFTLKEQYSRTAVCESIARSNSDPDLVY